MYDIFISYRRDGGHEMARLLYEHLKSKGLECFFDLEELGAGEFNVKLLDSIEDSKNFILILSPNSLERCHNEGDWVRCEIEHAIKCGKNIVPLMLPGFEWPDNLPESLAKLPFYNGVQLVREYFNASIDKLIEMLNLEAEPEEATLQEQTYQAAVLGMKTAKKKKQFEKLAEIFISLGLYKDSVEKTKECYALAQKVVRRKRLKIFIAACVTVLALAAAAGVWAYKQSQEDDKKEQDIPHTHTFGEWVVDKEATCIATGIRHHVCTTCKKSVSETIPINASAHNYASAWTSDGTNHWHKCQYSGCTSVKDKTAHTFGEWVVSKEATCDKAGTRYHVCTVCQKAVSEAIPATGLHNYETTWSANATNHWHGCQNSGCTSAKDKTAHTFGEWVIDVVDSCVQAGKRHHVCTVCNESVSESYTDPSAHNYSTTWTSDGTNHWHKCLNSGCTSVKDKTTHTFGEWIIDTPATCVKSGTRHHICTTCNKSVSESYSDSTAHNYATTWTTDGTNHWHKCQNSGCTSVKDKTAHSRDTICSVCNRFLSWGDNKYIRINKDGAKDAAGTYILFGEYPQTLKADSVTITSTTDSRGYYLGSDGFYYAKVTATPYSNGYKFSSGTTVANSTVYYFKVEPIRWRILSEDGDTVLILCDSIIANRQFDSRMEKYSYSEIRAWLNIEFYSTGFSSLQQNLIGIVPVDNGVALEDTNDKVFLLSCDEVTNADYGFSLYEDDDDTARRMMVSDYARATGASMSASSSYYGTGQWWLRSRTYPVVSFDGEVPWNQSASNGWYEYCYNANVGVAPALQICLSDSGYQVDATGLAYRVNEDGETCTITGLGTCTDMEVVIPTEIDGMRVTSIGEQAFYNCIILSSITIPDSVTSIGEQAFYGCSRLASIIVAGENPVYHSAGNCLIETASKTLITGCKNSVIPAYGSVTSIGPSAFRNCIYLTSIVISDSVTSIGENAFRGCSGLTSITIPDSVTSIGSGAFEDCTSLTNITIPDSVTSIGYSAFYGCTSITSITIPNSVTSIGEYAFYDCDSLTSIKFGGTKAQWQNISKDSWWKPSNQTVIVTCTDGTVKER